MLLPMVWLTVYWEVVENLILENIAASHVILAMSSLVVPPEHVGMMEAGVDTSICVSRKVITDLFVWAD